MSSALFSVIITTYNRRDVLPRAITSVLGQTDGAFELLVIDNGSTDDTAQVVARFTDPRISYVRNPEPSSSCDAPRNLGIQRAKGRYVAFLDDDDLWYPERLAKVKQAFEMHPDADAVCHHENRRVNGVVDRLLTHGPWSEHFFEALLYEGNRLSPCAITIRADLLRQLDGFRLSEAFDGAADYDLWLRMAAAGAKVHFLNEALGEFTVTGSNWSVTDPAFEAKVAHLITSHLAAYERRPVVQLSARAMRRLMQVHYLAARSFWCARRHRQAIKHLAYAVGCLVRRPSALGWVGTTQLRRWRSPVAVSGVSAVTDEGSCPMKAQVHG